MKLILLIAVCWIQLMSLATAQVTNPYDGTWRGTRPGFPDAELYLNGDLGTWKVFYRGAPAHNDACVVRTRPVVVQSTSADKLVFLINGSAMLSGCPDLQVTLKLVDSNTLEGRVGGNTMNITLIRK